MTFDRVVPVFSYDRAECDTAGVTNHVYDALYRPQATYPHKADKVIPGDIWTVGRPCTATGPTTTLPQPACRGLSRPSDSYMEGAGLSDGNFSVRYVLGAENSKAGSELSDWYGGDRILHNHAYGIFVN
ncbi:hypothetical protein ACWC0C_34630 [Streptomyces sp. NPDC001709]